MFARSQKIVPVRKEPRHIPEFSNKYIRVINAQIKDGDTSLFHVHSIPSAFVFLTDVNYDNQILDKPWETLSSRKGHAWFNGYESGEGIHRVAVGKKQRLHAYDIEILSRFSKDADKSWNKLPYDTLFNSNRCIAYKVELNKNNPSINFVSRGPMVAVLVSGANIMIEQSHSNKTIGDEGFGYIKPFKKCTIEMRDGDISDIVLFEIR
jgi:hypothetical protein